ncbi:unnamed protein product [Caenorhabditis angaria]|uniref:Oligopeptide transporter 1 n=1 Tax=Caenorhabditis angaria TaxID=860376 RepID=A0A9P1ISB1_9PELO|nr:unnamed protein product [Caenorhabditis angaria]
MRAVLMLYFVNILNFSDSNGIVLFHAFTVISYTTPLFGSILADGYIGKFWTIFSISIVYAIGQILLAVSSTLSPELSLHPWLDLLGLLIIGMGTGGIKPCVSAFGGDQFPANYTRMISMFFSIFYFSINAGSLLSMFISPMMRSIPCLGNDTCYPLAFGIPAILMIVATVVFMLGSFWYKKYPPKENVIFRVVRTIFRALRAKRNGNRAHWLDRSLDDHSCQSSRECKSNGKCSEEKFVDDVKVLIRVCVMMIPVPMFWALYDQQGSTWVLQAVAMDCRIFGAFTLLPDQMGVLNALLILVFIPIFQSGIYPAIEKMGYKLTMLRKMAAGGVLTALSFFICGIVQLFVNQSLATLPAANEAHLTIINTFPSCDFMVTVNENAPFLLPHGLGLHDDDTIQDPVKFQSANYFHPNISITSDAPNCPKFATKLSLSGGQAYQMTLTPTGWTYGQMNLQKPKNGKGEFAVSLNMMIPCENLPNEVSWSGCDGETRTKGYQGTLGLCKVESDTNNEHPCDPSADGKFYQFSDSSRRALYMNDYLNGNGGNFGQSYDNIDVLPGTYRLFYVNYTVPYKKMSKPTASQTVTWPLDLPAVTQEAMGGVYVITITNKEKLGKDVLAVSQTIVHRNHISILWQIPQYVIITAGEVMFSITGLEFAYSEASPQLKSVVQAIWLSTTAFGDLIDVAILALNLFSDVATQMFVFGGIMLIVIALFILLSIYYYEYADYTTNDDSESEKLAIE